MSKEEIARFLDDFQKLMIGDEGKRKLISLRVPERLLENFRLKSEANSIAYQTQIIQLMREWAVAQDVSTFSKQRYTPSKVVSGGQTGVDRAALDACLKLGIPCGGWCPQGRIAEDGVVSEIYPLRETPSDRYEQRTEWNIRDSDGTLILTWGKPQGGTLLTQKLTQKTKKPCIVIDFKSHSDSEISSVQAWLEENQVRVLNIAGPRGSFRHDVYAEAYKFVMNLLST